MQNLPFAVLRNPHMSYVYQQYFKTFDTLRKMPEIKTLKQNDDFCQVLRQVLRDNLSIVPRVVIGILETNEKMSPEKIDEFLTLLLKTRISRRVIAEQHLALTETYQDPSYSPDHDAQADVVGSIVSKLNPKSVVEQCAGNLRKFLKQSYGDGVILPELTLQGHLEATITYIPRHLEIILGEVLRNSFQAVIEQRQDNGSRPPPIEVTICESPQDVIIRISDQGKPVEVWEGNQTLTEAGLGIKADFISHLWSFGPGPRRNTRLDSFKEFKALGEGDTSSARPEQYDLSLNSFTTRPTDLRLGIGLPMARLYSSYLGGSLKIHSLEGYGVDAFLQISKLGNKNEQLSMRATLDAL